MIARGLWSALHDGFMTEPSPVKKWKRLKLPVVLLGLCIVVFVMLRIFEHSQVYHPRRGLDQSGAVLGRAWEDVRFKAADGVNLSGWYFPAEDGSKRKEYVVLVCHGNGGNIGHRLDLYDALLQTGAGVFAFDYRGYGLSQGRPSERGTYADAAAALKWLGDRGFAASRVIVLGESLGGGVASELAAREPLAGLVLLSSFTNIPEIGAELFPWLPVRLISSIRYDTHSRLPGIRMPLLVMHSRNDELVGFHHAEANFRVANEPKIFWELFGTHNEPLHQPDHFLKGIEALLTRVEFSPEASPVSARQ